MKSLNLEQTKKGYPAVWEDGGGCTNTGSAQIVAGPQGEALAPIYIRRRGHLAGGQHALFPAKEGQVVVQADHHREDFEMFVYRISQIREEVENQECGFCLIRWRQELWESSKNLDDWYEKIQKSFSPYSDCQECGGSGQVSHKELVADLILIAHFDMGEWDKEPPQELIAAIEAAKEKATCYHCRSPHYIAE
jgi:hypothetical protein